MSILNKFSLEGKNALVTGVSNSVGLCYGMAEAIHEAGAVVTLLDVSESVFNMAEELGGSRNGYHAMRCDITNGASRTEAMKQVLNIYHDKLDILLNGAGLQHRCPAETFPEEQLEKVLSVNLSGMFFVSQLAAANMIKNGKGKIINIASITAFCASRNIVAYAASKGGVVQLTKALSNEWSSKGINVNAIAPGYMLTEQTKEMAQTELGKFHSSRIPMGRWGVNDDLKGTVVYLASAASDYVSGAVIPVDGGYLGL